MTTAMFAKMFPLRTLAFLFVAASAQAQGAANTASDPNAHMQTAQRELAQHRPDLAIPELEKVVALEPRNVQAQTNLGVLLYFSNKFSEAEPHLRAGLALDPTQSKVRMLLGSCEHRSGRLEDARNDLSAAYASLQDPKVRKQAGLEIVEVDTAMSDLPAATLTVNQLKTAFPADPEVLYVAYRVYTDLAGESLLDLSVAAPDSAQFHQAIAHELIHSRDSAGAISNMREALKLNPNLPGGHFELGEMLHNSEHPEEKAEARQEYELALAQQPSDPATLTRLGDALGDTGDHAGAMARYQQALTAQPNFIDAKIGLAYQLTERGKPEDALPLLQSALQEDPSSVLAHYRLSAVYRRLHRPEDAKREIAEYERLKAIKEKLRTVYQDARSDAPQTDHAKP